MRAAENHSVREAEMLRPRLRPGLRFSIQESGGHRVCVIEDPFASRFHRVGLAEYHFFRALDGSQSMASILARLARDGSGESFTEAEALQMVRWLKDNHLLAVESTRPGGEREHSAHALRFAMTWLNPLVLKLPLARPDRFFSATEPTLRWALGGFGLALWLLVVATGAAHVAMDWTRFGRDFGGILSRDNWLWLLLVWAGLKIAHEFGHGIFCKHFGAAVREVGMIFVLFVPMGYVDATASLGLASKWRRIMVASAGLYVEFFLAALAALVWAHTAPGTLHTAAHNAVVTGTVVTLLFNANPLMRFDGYFVLSELLDLPNLATRGKNWTQRALSWLVSGARQLRPARLRTREEWIVALYGVAALGWQVLVVAGLLVGASTLLKGGGLGLAVVAGIAWVAVPLWRFGASLADSVGAGIAAGLRFAARVTVLAAVPAAALFVPFHRSVTSPGVVELADTHALRVECPGFVSQVLVRDGEMVTRGQLLLELTNDEAAAALDRSRLDLAQQELRARMAFSKGDVSAFQSENAQAESLRTTVAERASYLATRQIRAPMDGRVTNRNLAQMTGTFLQSGSEALRLGRGAGSDVKIAISQGDEPHWREVAVRPLRAKIAGRGGVFDAHLVRLEPRATRELPDPALTALAGGPLALRRNEEPAATEPGTRRGPEYELADPHFTATARLLAPATFSPGEMALVKFRSPRTATLWGQCQGALARWLKRCTDPAS
jgi:putative peptide zinc metalloprotease protein